jgi:type III secretion system HrpE/YscL family protein
MTLGTVFRTQTGAGMMTAGARLPAQTLHALRRAEDIVREAEAAATAIRAQAAQEAVATKAQARADGFAQGRMEALSKTLGTLELERRLRELLAEQLADVVERSLRSLLTEPGEQEVLHRRVLHLLRCGGVEENLASPATLYACPAEAELLRDMLSVHGNELGALAVVADERRPHGNLLLEMRGGFVESDRELTIEQLREVVRRAADHATAHWERAA